MAANWAQDPFLLLTHMKTVLEWIGNQITLILLLAQPFMNVFMGRMLNFYYYKNHISNLTHCTFKIKIFSWHFFFSSTVIHRYRLEPE